MCGRFVQSMTREDYLALLADESERDISLNLEPTSQLYSARDIKVQLLNLYGIRSRTHRKIQRSTRNKSSASERT